MLKSRSHFFFGQILSIKKGFPHKHNNAGIKRFKGSEAERIDREKNRPNANQRPWIIFLMS